MDPIGEVVLLGQASDGKYYPLACTTPTQATGTLTSDNTNVANNDTVTIGSKTYTFKTALTPAEGEVLIGADADASLLNLINAINDTGNPVTDYRVRIKNDQVTAAPTVTAHAMTITAIADAGLGNAIVTTETSAHLAWGATTLTGGKSATLLTSA